MSNLIQFERRKVNPVEGLLKDVGQRIGPGKVSGEQRKKQAATRRKELKRKASGLVRVTYDINPEIAQLVRSYATDLEVPISQVAEALIVAGLAELTVAELMDEREINTSSKRYGYTLRGAPLKNQRGTP